jgi:protein associated with RNAse G/E
MLPEVGKTVYIQSFKHDGSLHRTWCKGFVLEADEDRIVAVTDRAWVIEADDRKWLTREPAVCFYYTKKWYNIISMIRHSGIYYYCNLASPSIYDGEAIKNIDYDLDVKLYPDGGYQILDENEYADHADKMNYPEIIKKIVEHQMEDLIEEMDRGNPPFNKETIDHYYRLYLRMAGSNQ